MKTVLNIVGALGLCLISTLPVAGQHAPSDAGQPSEGIQVHGHWTVEIYEGDVLVERHEFENALTAYGAAQILSVMAGAATPGPWNVGIDAVWGTPSGTVDCPLFDVLSAGVCFTDGVAAAVSLPTSGENAGGLVLEKSYVNTEGTLTISQVATSFETCGSSVAPDDCNLAATTAVTQTAQSVSASQNQTVQIQVVITLS